MDGNLFDVDSGVRNLELEAVLLRHKGQPPQCIPFRIMEKDSGSTYITSTVESHGYNYANDLSYLSPISSSPLSFLIVSAK